MNARILEASYENKVKKLCFISSNTVYPVTEFAVKEKDVNFNYFEEYFIVGWMKRFSEIMCEMYSKKISNPMPIIIIRPGNLYGPFDKYTWKESKVIAALIRKAVERHSPLEVWGKGKDEKDFLYITDFIYGPLTVFAKSSEFTIVNLASGQSKFIHEVLSLILQKTGYINAVLKFNSKKPKMIPKRLINIDKAKKDFQWKPKISLSEGIERTVIWYRKTYARKTPEKLFK